VSRPSSATNSKAALRWRALVDALPSEQPLDAEDGASSTMH
jgi:hypothetical protein